MDNFASLEQDLKHQLLELIDDGIRRNPSLLNHAIRQQVRLHREKAFEHYAARDSSKLLTLMTSLSPTSAIMLNMEIALVNDRYMDEGVTLSRMLLPFLHSMTDYSFLLRETFFVMGRFLNALTTHYRDSSEPLSTGFILFAMHVNAKTLNGLISCPSSKDALRKALTILNFPLSTCIQITVYPNKFLYPELLSYLRAQSSDIIDLLVTVLAKMDILTDPGAQMRELESALSQRSKIGSLLTMVDHIKLSLP